MITTTVYDLDSDIVQIFSLPAKTALIAAREQARGNFETWNYPTEQDVNFSEGIMTIMLDDYDYREGLSRFYCMKPDLTPEKVQELMEQMIPDDAE